MDYSKVYKEIGFKTEVNRLRKQAEIGFYKELRMLRLLGLKDNSSILEIGSGPGFYTELLLNNFNNITITCLDYDIEFLKYARNNIDQRFKDRVSYVKDNVENTSLKNDSYDYVIARFVFQHLDNPLEALKEIKRLLKPGGKLFIIDVDNDLWGTSYPKSNLIDNLNSSIGKFQNKLNGNRLIGRELIPMIKKVGFINFDIEAVINHSDVLGKENFVNKFDPNLIKDINMKKILTEYNRYFSNDNSSIMILKIIVIAEKEN